MDIKRIINNHSSVPKPSEKRNFFDFLKGFFSGYKNPIGYLGSKKIKLIFSLLLILLIILPVYFIFFSKKSAEASWWDEKWFYRKSIPVTNSSGSNLTDFQIKILNNYDLSPDITAGKIQTDLDDLRFTSANGEVLNYWIEDNTNNSVDVWIKLPSIPTTSTTVYMYYGNPSATAYDNLSGLVTGGKVTMIAGYRVHTFINNGNFTAGPLTSAESLIVAGGGGGGSSQTSGGGGGGGGAGGLIYNASFSMTQDQILAVAIGNGGAPGTAGANQSGNNGENSSLGSFVAIGGGGGGKQSVNGNNGGSGGGGGYNSYTTIRYGGSGTSGQ